MEELDARKQTQEKAENPPLREAAIADEVVAREALWCHRNNGEKETIGNVPKPYTELTDLEIRDSLLAHDERLTQWFFFIKCRPLFRSLIKLLFHNNVDYDEYVNEIYTYLMENGAFRLKSYDGTGSIFSWMKITIYNQSLKIKKERLMIEDRSENTPIDRAEMTQAITIEPSIARMDLMSLLSLLEKKNGRYAYVLRRAIIDDAPPEAIANEIDVKIANLYNIKKRAIAELTAIALEKKNSKA